MGDHHVVREGCADQGRSNLLHDRGEPKPDYVQSISHDRLHSLFATSITRLPKTSTRRTPSVSMTLVVSPSSTSRGPSSGPEGKSCLEKTRYGTNRPSRAE